MRPSYILILTDLSHSTGRAKDLKDLPVAKQQELDELNTDVLAKLADKNLFSQGETAEGRVCIKIGLVRVTYSIYSCNFVEIC